MSRPRLNPDESKFVFEVLENEKVRYTLLNAELNAEMAKLYPDMISAATMLEPTT